MQKLNVGDKVSPPRGSPVMTINAMYQGGDGRQWCECVWYSSDDFMERRRRLPSTALRKVPISRSYKSLISRFGYSSIERLE